MDRNQQKAAEPTEGNRTKLMDVLPRIKDCTNSKLAPRTHSPSTYRISSPTDNTGDKLARVRRDMNIPETVIGELVKLEEKNMQTRLPIQNAMSYEKSERSSLIFRDDDCSISAWR